MVVTVESGSGLSTNEALVLGLASSVVLAVLHLLAPRIRRLPGVPEHATASFAGGLAVAYVFLHLLPELAAGGAELRGAFQEEGERSPLLGLEIFVVALVGFVVFYALERVAERSGRPVEERDDGDAPDPNVFRVHLASFAVYNALIAYTLPLDWQTSVPFTLLFVVAIGLHFVLTDRGLEEHYGDRFDRRPPRLLLAAGLLAGWSAAWVFAPQSSLVVSVVTAFLAGSILLNVFKEEIPSTRQSHLGWFVVGLVVYSILLGLVTATRASA